MAEYLPRLLNVTGEKWRRLTGNVYFVKIGTKLGQNHSEMEVRTFARIKKVIWDQLLVTKAEMIKGKL